MLDFLNALVSSKLFWLIAVPSIVLYCYLKFVKFTYWKRHGLPYEEPTFVFGNIGRSCLGLTSIGEDVRRNYEKFRDEPVHGIYILSNAILVINDPEIIRFVLVKEFSKFRDRGLYHNDIIDPLTSNLFFLPGEKWKRLRTKLTPTFSSGKLKKIYPLLKEISDELGSVVARSLKHGSVLEVKDLSARYTTDTIASIAFGYNCDSLNNPDSEFRKYGDMIIKKRPTIMVAFGMFSPSVLHFLRVPLIPKPVFNFFIETFSSMLEYRKRERIARNDFLNLLIQLIEKGQVEDCEEAAGAPGETDRITEMEAYAQAFVFFFAGFETSASTIAYGLYELALNPDVQDKVYEEIRELLDGPGGCSYDNCVNGVKYLDMVVYETLRKHPTSPFLNRICIEECQLPNVDYRVPKGMKILIPATGIMRNEKYYPDPDKFDPERFNSENVESRSPYVFLSFGQGPRSCIGIRLGMIQTKLAFISLLSQFKFSPCEKTPIPLKYSPESIVQVPAEGIYLQVQRR